MGPQRTVLLLNASNLMTNLTYPYAFVQVSEIADRFNICTISRDMFGIPENQWIEYLQDLFKKTKFDMVLITLRNTDTVDSDDYMQYRQVGNQLRAANKYYHQPTRLSQYKQPHYYPIESTKILIKKLRKVTNVPIATGGYAFSIMPEKLMTHLKTDYGVIGGPDAFFKHFEDILEKENLDQVANLLYRKNNILQKGPLHFFPPAARREYTDEIITDLNTFYSRFSGQDVSVMTYGVPIEVVRGCSMKCTYCSEPLVEGTELRYRNLDVIEDEINFLGSHGLNRIIMICSEINAGGNDFFLKLADRIIRINEKRSSYEKVHWFAFYLLTLSPTELKHLRNSDFIGGANDVVSLDDKNRTALKIPYKTKEILNHIIGAKKVIEEEFQQKDKKRPSLEERIFKRQQHMGFAPFDSFMKSWNFWLGNFASTPETIRVTLKAVDNVGLNQLFDSCYVGKATRMYDYIRPDNELLNHTWSMTDDGLLDPYDELYPSYVSPPALLRHFGSVEALEEFFILVGDTYLSLDHLFRKEWNWFLANNIDMKTFFAWWNTALSSGFKLESLCSIPEVLEFLIFLHTSPSIEKINLLFNPTPGRKALINFATHIAIRFVLFSQEKDLIPVMKFLGLPQSLEGIFVLSPYKVAVKLFELYADKDELLTALNATSFNKKKSRFFVEYLIYLNNTPLKAVYNIFFKKG